MSTILNSNEIFSASILPTLCGSYFRLSELAAEHAQNNSEEIRSYLSKTIAALKNEGGDVVKKIREVEALALRAGFEAPDAPRFPHEYVKWFHEVQNGFYNELTPNDPNEIIYRCGYIATHIVSDLRVLQFVLNLVILSGRDQEFLKAAITLFLRIRDQLDDLRLTAKSPRAHAALPELAATVTDCVDFVNLVKRLAGKENGLVSADGANPALMTLKEQEDKILTALLATKEKL